MSSATPVMGAPAELEAQGTLLALLQIGATGDGNGLPAPTDGYDGNVLVEIQKTGAGTSTANLEGSFDGVVWYAVGYQQIDGVAAPARSAGAVALGAGAISHVYQVLDCYPLTRCRLSGTAGAVAVQARLYAIPT